MAVELLVEAVSDLLDNVSDHVGDVIETSVQQAVKNAPLADYARVAEHFGDLLRIFILVRLTGLILLIAVISMKGSMVFIPAIMLNHRILSLNGEVAI